MHEKKHKGDRGVGHVIARLIDLGWNVGVPISEHAAYDLFAEKNSKVHTVQVRYSTPKEGKVEIKLKSSWADKNGNHTRKRTKGDYTMLAVYVPNRGVFFVSDEQLGDCENSLVLRFELPKNSQTKGVKMAEGYRELI